MKRLSDTAIEIINELHKEILDYSSEYIPLIDAANRLAAYEDTDLEPEEIKKHEAAYNECLTRTYGPFKQKISQWLQAEQDGRLVVLPCKVGDSVYIPDLDKKIPVKVRVQGISISVSGRTILHFGGYPVECAWGDGCGKDWFLTREEAETALAQEGDTHEADPV